MECHSRPNKRVGNERSTRSDCMAEMPDLRCRVGLTPDAQYLKRLDMGLAARLQAQKRAGYREAREDEVGAMTRLLVILALLTGFLLIFYFTGVIAQFDEPLGEGWYLVGPTV